MKIKSATYSITFELPFEFGIERWRKVGLEIEPEKNEKVEEILDVVDKQIKTWHEAKFPELYGKPKPKKQLPVISTSGEYVNEDKEWEKVKSVLNSFKYREDAQEYLSQTDYRLLIQAKKIVSSKPTK